MHRNRRSLLLIVLTVIVANPVAWSAEVTPQAEETWWRFEESEQNTATPAEFIYDPLTQRSYRNRTVLPPSAESREHVVPYQSGTSFTLECYVKLNADPRRDAKALTFGGHAVGVHFLPRWKQTYWSGFSDQTSTPAWSTGHYVTISRVVDADPSRKQSGNLAWRHLALTYDAESGALTAWLDHWQTGTQTLAEPLVSDGVVRIGGEFPGLIDEVRFTPRLLQPHEFLRASPVELESISFDTPNSTFPRDAGHLDIRRHFGAVGDGKHDDTAAFQRAMRETEQHTIVFVPAGTYLVSDTIYWRQWRLMIGEDESRTIIRLKDDCPGYDDPERPKPVIRTHFNNNQSFENFIQHLIVDTGHGNGGAVGIRYNAHNTGELGHVTIRSGDGSGVIGLDLSETEFGPALVRDVTVEGFDVGIQTPGNVSHATMENITLRNQNEVGFRNRMPVSLKDFRSENAVPAIENSGWMAQLTLLDATLIGQKGTGPAIRMGRGASGDFRRVAIDGYAAFLESDAEGDSLPAEGDGIDHLIVGKTHTLFEQPADALDLPAADAPPAFVQSPAGWVTPDDSAADDTRAIQATLESGAATIYLRNRTTYTVSETLRVPPTVRRIVGMKSSLRGDPKIFGREKPLLQITGGDGSTPPLHIEHVGISFYPEQGYGFEIDSPRDVVLRYSSGWVRNTARATGRLFVEEQMGWVHLFHPQRAWIRQLDTEGHRATPEEHHIYLLNRGGTVWVFGMKTEWFSVHAETTNGGRTEILGGFFRDHVGSSNIPYFRTIDADLSANWVQYAWRPGAARALQAVETQDGVTRTLELKPSNQVIGRYRAGDRPRDE